MLWCKEGKDGQGGDKDSCALTGTNEAGAVFLEAQPLAALGRAVQVRVRQVRRGEGASGHGDVTGALYFYDFYAGCLHVLCMFNKKDHENTRRTWLFIVIFASSLTGVTGLLVPSDNRGRAWQGGAAPSWGGALGLAHALLVPVASPTEMAYHFHQGTQSFFKAILWG